MRCWGLLDWKAIFIVFKMIAYFNFDSIIAFLLSNTSLYSRNIVS